VTFPPILTDLCFEGGTKCDFIGNRLMCGDRELMHTHTHTHTHDEGRARPSKPGGRRGPMDPLAAEPAQERGSRR